MRKKHSWLLATAYGLLVTESLNTGQKKKLYLFKAYILRLSLSFFPMSSLNIKRQSVWEEASTL